MSPKKVPMELSLIGQMGQREMATVIRQMAQMMMTPVLEQKAKIMGQAAAMAQAIMIRVLQTTRTKQTKVKTKARQITPLMARIVNQILTIVVHQDLEITINLGKLPQLMMREMMSKARCRNGSETIGYSF